MFANRAIEHLTSYTPDLESLEGNAGDVPPLTEFFEMVHVGDVIQQMVQLYYDEEIVSIFVLRKICQVKEKAK